MSIALKPELDEDCLKTQRKTLKRSVDEKFVKEAKRQKCQLLNSPETSGESLDRMNSESMPNNFSNVFKPTRSYQSYDDGTKKKLVIKNFNGKLNNKNGDANKVDENYLLKECLIVEQSVNDIFLDQKTNITLESLFQNVEISCQKNTPRQIYDRLMKVIIDYCVNLKKLFDDDIGDMLVDVNTCGDYLFKFQKIWAVYPMKINLIRNIYLYLDRLLLTCQSTNTDILPIWESSMRIFRRTFFPELDNEFRSIKLFQAVYYNFQRISQEMEANRDPIRPVLRMISTCQINDEFLDYLVTELRQYYNNLRLAMLPVSMCNEYMAFAYKQIKDYSDICQTYICQEYAIKKIYSTILEMLVESALPDVLNHEFDKLLESDDVEDVKRMFHLCSKCTTGEEYVRSNFAKYIKEKGTKMMDSCQDDDLFNELLLFKKKMDVIISEGFAEADTNKFRQTLRDAFEYFINQKGNKAAELIARYFHGLLRMCHKKATDDSLDKMLDDAIVVFRFVHGKDVFEAYYKRDLARRLLFDRSASVDAEKSVLAKLKMECGAGFTHKLEGMFKDMETSEDLNRLFSQHMEHEKRPKTNMNVRVLTSDHWPSYDLYEICLPKEMRDTLIDFGEFYKQQHGNRNVNWNYALSTAVISAKFRPGYTKELIGSLFHAVILLLFNKSEKWTVNEIVDATKIEKIEVIRTILALAGGRGKPRVLKIFGDGKKELKMDAIEEEQFVVNSEFAEKLYRIRIAQVQLKATKEEKEKVEKEVSQDRQYQIDAAIVRIMKARKELLHSQLIHEVLTQLKFPVKGVDIKTRIGSLIDRDYISRDEGDTNKYKYVA